MKPKFIHDRAILVHPSMIVTSVNRKEIFSAFILKGVYDFISSNNNTVTGNYQFADLIFNCDNNNA